MQIQRIDHQQTWPLRSKILRPGLPLSACQFDGDELVSTIHLGAFNKDQEIVGICSIFERKNPDIAAKNQFQLRAMAVANDKQTSGVGTLLITTAEQLLTEAGVKAIWANARTEALGFYKKRNYLSIGDVFEIAGVGPHRLIYKQLTK